MRASETASAVNMEDMIQWGSPGLENRDVGSVGGGSNPLSSADDVSNGCYTRPVKPWSQDMLSSSLRASTRGLGVSHIACLLLGSAETSQAALEQLVVSPDSQSGGHGFESRTRYRCMRHTKKAATFGHRT